jgi:broad specificity phosphatase PhoE
MIDGARLLLVRHGRHDWLYPPINRFAGHLPGVPLNADGRAEAHALGRRLRASPPDRIVSSPVERAVETATIIAEVLARVVMTDERITETGMGSWEGLPVSEAIARFPAQWHAWRTAPTTVDIPGMEKVDAIGARMFTAAVDYLSQGGTTLLVSHQDPLLALVCRLLDLPLDAMRRMEISPASLTIVEVVRGQFVLVTLNSTTARVAGPQAPPAGLTPVRPETT